MNTALSSAGTKFLSTGEENTKSTVRKMWFVCLNDFMQVAQETNFHIHKWLPRL
jgi:hypothetical protein